ncbi:hypothetical protein WDW86_03565 [Bdellovibrionota bacterium FG-2]
MSKKIDFTKATFIFKRHFAKWFAVTGVVLAGLSVLAIYSSMHSEVWNGSRSPAAIGRARLPIVCPTGLQKASIQGRLYFDPGARSKFLASFVRPTPLNPTSSFDYSLDYRVVQARYYSSVSGSVDPVVNSDGTFSAEICWKPSSLNLAMIPREQRSIVAAQTKNYVFEFRVQGKSHDSTLALNSCQSSGKPYINGQLLAQCGSFDFSSSWQPLSRVADYSVFLDKTTKDLAAYQKCGSALLSQYAEVCQYGGANPAVLSLGDSEDYNFGEINVDANFKGLIKKTLTVSFSGLLKAKSMSMSIVPPGTPFSFTSGVYPGTNGTCGAETKGNCKLELQFVPQAPGNYEATLFLSYHNGIGPQKTQVTLSGSRLDIPTCSDGVKNATESDTDCGGGGCQKCVDLKSCISPTDCVSGICTAGVCHSPTCADKLFNGAESDVDCGGPICSPCQDGKFCKASGDCTSNLCKDGQCIAPSCSDGIQNGLEKGVDCGGICATACGSGSGCAKATDCLNGVCAFGKCADPSCNDGVKNGTESAVDCGGVCPKCSSGQSCATGADCVDGMCQSGMCIKATCIDAVKNGAETDVDCGGTCQACIDGKSCSKGSDCSSNNCINGKCAAASCNDMLKNAMESDIDCGGPACPHCGLGKTCSANTDCYGPTQSCQGGVCKNFCAAGQILCGATCVDPTSDDANCGSCGKVCPSIVNGSGACINSVCGVKQCNSGYANCDMYPGNGCETTLYNDVKNCGNCGLACPNYQNATASCNNMVCGIQNCMQGFSNCNNNTNDGCEINTNSDVNNCGACGIVCGWLKSCVLGVCK